MKQNLTRKPVKSRFLLLVVLVLAFVSPYRSWSWKNR